MNLYEFISTLIWQLLVLGFVWLFRSELGNLLTGLKSFKACGFEAEMQEHSNDAEATNVLETPDEASDAKNSDSSESVIPPKSPPIKLYMEDGFYTDDSIRHIAFGKDNPPRHALLLFKTSKQHTWLVFGDSQIVCILDDANTREANSMLQWALPYEKAKPISARRISGKAAGRVDIGTRRNWLYSPRLFSDPVELENAIKARIPRQARMDKET